MSESLTEVALPTGDRPGLGRNDGGVGLAPEDFKTEKGETCA